MNQTHHLFLFQELWNGFLETFQCSSQTLNAFQVPFALRLPFQQMLQLVFGCLGEHLSRSQTCGYDDQPVYSPDK